MVAPIVLVRDRNGVWACRGDTGPEHCLDFGLRCLRLRRSELIVPVFPL
jgi:hypothetical protein